MNPRLYVRFRSTEIGTISGIRPLFILFFQHEYVHKGRGGEALHEGELLDRGGKERVSPYLLTHELDMT